MMKGDDGALARRQRGQRFAYRGRGVEGRRRIVDLVPEEPCEGFAHAQPAVTVAGQAHDDPQQPGQRLHVFRRHAPQVARRPDEGVVDEIARLPVVAGDAQGEAEEAGAETVVQLLQPPVVVQDQPLRRSDDDRLHITKTHEGGDSLGRTVATELSMARRG